MDYLYIFDWSMDYESGTTLVVASSLEDAKNALTEELDIPSYEDVGVDKIRRARLSEVETVEDR